MTMILTTMALVLATGAVSAGDIQLSFIDHNNLRYPFKLDEPALRAQTDEAKRNIERAKSYGASSYVLFSRGFESMVCYDFAVDSLGDLAGVIYPPKSDHRERQALYAKHLNEVLDYAQEMGIRVIFHSNQFDFPEALYRLAGGRLSGTARVCPGKPLPYQLLEGKLREFFTRFPKCAGIQLTLSETQAKISECNCDTCRNLSADERFLRIVEAANRACESLGKTLMVRTWGGFGSEETISRLPKSVICSTKNTSGDFHLNSQASDLIGVGADIQEVEFDAWGEYSGYNHFPCYLGDIYAERVRLCAQRGVKRLAIRLNWNHDVNHIFSRPFGNEANIHVFAGLARNPNADPDDLLREYISRVFPASARQAAYRLYKRSADLQKVWLTWRGQDAIDHSRVFQDSIARVESQVGRSATDDYGGTCKAIAQRRTEIDTAYREAISLVDALGPDVPAEWKEELKRGARNEWFVAQANSDCIVLLAAYRQAKAGQGMPDLSSLGAEIRRRARLWQHTDPDMFEVMLGACAVTILDEVTSAAGAP